MPNLVYQRWIEVDPPAGVSGPPMWSWPVVLPGGGLIVTMMWRPLPAAGGKPGRPTCQILAASTEGEVSAWGPGAGYPAPVIFYASDEGELWGLDLTKPGSVYACRADGTHLVTARITPAMGTLVSPEYFLRRGDEAFWIEKSGRKCAGKIRGGDIVDVRTVESLPARDEEVRFPHTHATRGRLIVLDFDPMARIGVWTLNDK